MRTCVGCRERGAATELLRVVAAPASAPGLDRRVVADVGHRLPGRGAWIHRTPACLGLAIRRRAFARALRVPGPVDVTDVEALVSSAQAVRPVQ